jgi:hypothetical protein
MVYFQTKNPSLGKILSALEWKMLIYFMAIRNISRHSGYFMTIWYILCLLALFPVLVSRTKKNLATLSGGQEASGEGIHFSWTWCRPGLPDFYWHKIPKREKYTKLPRTVPNVHKI